MRTWTTHKEYLVVFIIMQNLVEIDAVVLVICKFSYFTILLENAYSRPQNGVLGEFDHLNGKW